MKKNAEFLNITATTIATAMFPQFGDYSSIRYRDGKVYRFDYKERCYVPTEKANVFTKRQKQLYHKTFSGLQAGLAQDDMLIFWTLTTEYDKSRKESALLVAERVLNDHFQVWKKRVCRYIQHKKFMQWFQKNFPTADLNTIEGRRIFREEKNHLYTIHAEKRPWYYNFRYRMCYFKVRTTEGGGVIHGFLRKSRDVPMLDHAFLKRTWDEIHGAEQVEIHEIKPRKEGDTPLSSAMQSALYACGHYFNQQPVVRASSSYNWIFKGASAVWNRGKTILAPKKRKHIYHPACSCNECNNHIPRIISQKNPYADVMREDRPNVLLKRPSLITAFMNSRKSMRRDSGYDNALFFWLCLTRNPPADTRQKHIHEHKWSILSATLIADGLRKKTFLLFKRCTTCNAVRHKEATYKFK